MLHRRKFLAFGAASLAVPAVVARRAFAESWPTREVKIVVGFEPGGATDMIARTLAERLKEVWGQPVTVENKPGHGGNLAAEMVAKAQRDGYTILIVGPGQALNQYMYAKLAYDPVKDFAPVTLLVSQANVMAVSTNSPIRSVKDFIDYCKANPGKATYASSGVGTSLHLCGELFEHLAQRADQARALQGLGAGVARRAAGARRRDFRQRHLGAAASDGRRRARRLR